MPCWSLVTFVTNKSSPTNWHLLPTEVERFFQPSQSSSAIPSSIEAIGYCLTQLAQNFTNWSLVISLPLLLWKTYFFFFASQSSLLAASMAIWICEPDL